ncbi:pseudouridine synthase [Ignatzschineria sp. LJL83]
MEENLRVKERYRLDQFLQLALGISRKEAGKAIRNRWVNVNDELVTQRDFKVTEDDVVVVDDEIVTYRAQKRYFLLHKPAGYVSSHRHDGHISLFRLIEEDEDAETLHIAGRLDADTTGMVLITDDGAWSHRIMRSSKNSDEDVAKVYEIILARPITDEMIEALETGVELRGDELPTRPAIVERLAEKEIRLTIREGRYHQVKRMLAAVGNHVESLHRAAIGHLTLDGLHEGEYRSLTDEEIEGF